MAMQMISFAVQGDTFSDVAKTRQEGHQWVDTLNACTQAPMSSQQSVASASQSQCSTAPPRGGLALPTTAWKHSVGALSPQGPLRLWAALCSV